MLKGTHLARKLQLVICLVVFSYHDRALAGAAGCWTGEGYCNQGGLCGVGFACGGSGCYCRAAATTPLPTGGGRGGGCAAETQMQVITPSSAGQARGGPCGGQATTFAAPPPGQSADYHFCFTGFGAWDQPLLVPGCEMLEASGLGAPTGVIVVRATRRMPPDDQVADLSYVQGSLSSGSHFLPCYGQTGPEDGQITSLVGTMDLQTGDFDIDVNGSLTNDIYLPGSPATAYGFVYGTLDFSTGLSAVYAGSRLTLPSSVDSNGDGAIDVCRVPIRVIYVNASIQTPGNGSSWAQAVNNLQTAIGMANRGDQIWVKAGVYHPTTRTNQADPRSVTFMLKNAVAIYGAFNGTEATLSDRLPGPGNATILSCDLAQNDVPPMGNRADNCYHVVTGDTIADATVLDRVIIRAGHANGAGDDSKGGGLFNKLSSAPRVVNCRFDSNFAASDGGGMYNAKGSAVVVSGAVFLHNTAVGLGGGVFNSESAPWFANCRFLGNVGQTGGGGAAHLDSMSVFVNTLFAGNSTPLSGGAMDALNSDISIVNGTLSANTAGDDAGGLYAVGSNVNLANSILWNNSDSSGPTESAQFLKIGGGQNTIQFTCLQGWTGAFGGTGNFSADPQFENPAGPDAQNGTLDDDYTLTPRSPCIDDGNDSLVPLDIGDINRNCSTAEAVSIDLLGAARFVRQVDLGALELPTTGPAIPLADPTGIDKVRYLSFQLSPTAIAANETALEIKLLSLMHPSPPNLPQFPAPNFTAFEGQFRYVGTPTNCAETESPSTTYKCASLQCSTLYIDWPAAVGTATLHVTGRDVIPSSTYEVRQLAASCQGIEATCTAISAALTISTQRWGDIVAPFQATGNVPLTQPNIGDIAACVDKFRGLPSAPITARADINPAIPNAQVQIPDIASVVDAFKAFAYPFTGTSGPQTCP